MKRLISSVIVVAGWLGILLSSTSLIDDVVAWKSWFEEGILDHYRTVRSWLFGWLPWTTPDWVQDLFVLWTGFSFWSTRARAHAEKALGTPDNPAESVSWATRLGGPFGLAYLLYFLTRAGIETVKPAPRFRIGKSSRVTSMKFSKEVNEGYRRRMVSMMRKLAKSILVTGLTIAIVFIAVLFVASDALQRITGG